MNPKLLCILLCSALLLLSCSTPPVMQEPKATDTPLPAKAWLANLPQGDFAIGIAYADPVFGSASSALAKDFAAVQLSRNHASFVVDKEVILNLAQEREIDIARMSFNFVVSADMDFLHRAAANLVQLDSFVAGGYHFGLYGLSEAKLSNTETSLGTSEKPSWSRYEGIYVKGNHLFSVATSRQADLTAAFSLAQEQALRQIAQYRLQNVLVKIRSIDDRTDQALALETVTRNQFSQCDAAYIVHHRIGEQSSYTVYLQMRAEK